MKPKIFSINVLFVCLLWAGPAQAADASPAAAGDEWKSPLFTTGEDWTTRMTLREKYMSIVAPMSLYNQYGVPFRHAPEQYIPAIDRVMRNNPHLLDKDVANIFASTVYRVEPESRASFDQLEERFLRGEYGPELRVSYDVD